ncbi:MAG: histidine kinase [Burkholderiaceae bacterium]|jgi:sensor histidine kinase YesM|nr:histidine kinase [Burkholderiaceae bacterium]
MSVAHELKRAWAAWWSPTFSASLRVPLWATLTVTVLWNTAIGLALTAVFWVFSSGRLDVGRMLWMNLLTAHCIGFSIFAAIGAAGRLVGEARIDAWPGPQRGWFFSLLVLAGVFVGYGIAFVLIGIIDARFSAGRWFSGWFVGSVLLVWALLSLLFWRFYADRARIAEAESARVAERARAEQLERQALDAQLRTLQAQIEPHFLFNTLANVVSLVDAQPADAKRMLERLIDLLRGSLSASRAQRTTLGAELDLVRAYLDILAIRMAGRLRYAIEVAPALRSRPLAPLLLQPLVENAIQHGLEPKIEGGRVRVTASEVDGMLDLVVEDDGVGFGATTRGGGVGLSNLRERIAALFGPDAHMQIEDAQPGTRVRLRLPQGAAAPADASALAAGAAAAA